MSLGWVDDPELDAAHARAAVLIGEAEQLPAGPGLAAALVGVQGLVMDCSTAVRTTVLWDRLTAWTQAQAMISATEAVTAADLPVFLDAEDTARLVGQELAVRTATGYGTQSRRLALIDQVARELPAAWVALDRGQLSLAHLSRLAGELRSCPPGLAGQVDGRLVPQAVEHGWTPAQLARAARRELIAADPAGAADRAETAKGFADVQIFPGPDQTATLWVCGDALTLHAVSDLVDHAADRLADTGDTRPAGARRFTALTRLILNHTQPAAATGGEQPDRDPDNRLDDALDRELGWEPTLHAEVLVTIDLTSLLGLTEHPAELAGYGPITAQTARLIAADATLRRLVTDPVTGIMIDLGGGEIGGFETSARGSSSVR